MGGKMSPQILDEIQRQKETIEEAQNTPVISVNQKHEAFNYQFGRQARTAWPRAIEALEVAIEALQELTHWDSGHDAALVIKAQDKIESILKGGGDE